MLGCVWNCLRRIPWWVWLILAAAALLFAIIAYFSGGIAALTLPLWIEAALIGFGSTFGATLLLCLTQCTGRR